MSEGTLSEPKRWVVVKGQCLPIKQELEKNVSSLTVKPENLVGNGECLPIKQELEEKC